MAGSSDHPIRKLLILAHHRMPLWVVPEWFAERLRSEFPQFDIVRLTTLDGIDSELAETEILYSASLRPEQFAVAKKLRWISSHSAAVHQFMYPELINSDVILTNGREIHGPVVAEHVIALLFALAKRLPQIARFQSQHLWGQQLLYERGQTPAQLAGATLGLVGLGSIGRNVAQRATALGMRVIAVRERADRPKPDHVDEVFSTVELKQMLQRADYVVLSPPLTPATKGMIGAEQLAAMKPSAFLINVGRGPLIDEPALIDALRERKIAGAALDVFDKEPLPQDSPLWDLPNLLITPHTAGMDVKMWEKQYDFFATNLQRYLAGQPLLAVVDKKLGY